MEFSTHYLLMADHAMLQKLVMSRIKPLGLTTGQEICDLTGAAGLGLGQMNNVLDADHRDRRSDAEDKRADEHDRAGQIHLEKRRHERNRKLKVHQYGCDSRKNCGVGDFAGFCHCCFFSLSGVLFHK